jgi:phage terminase large subunit-like protein
VTVVEEPPRTVCRPLIQTPSPEELVAGAWFDQDAVDRVVRFFGKCRHIKGEWAGNPIVLDAWQVEYLIAPTFGWKDAQGFRIVRTAWWEMPRKQGKSSLGSGIGLCLTGADDEPGAEVYAAAGSRRQARQVFDPARLMVRRGAPVLRHRFKPHLNVIEYPDSDSFFEVISADANLQHGLNVHGAVIDEVHIHKRRDLIDALSSGTGARRQPLLLYITTADEDDPTGIYDEMRTYIERLANGTIVDASTYGVVFAAPEDADPFAEETWEAANPGIDRSVKREYLRAQALKARSNPAFLPTFKRLHLGIRSRPTTASLFDLEAWDACDLPYLPDDEVFGADAWGGLDLASTSDFAAWMLIIPHPDETVSLYPRFFLPETALESRRSQMSATLAVWQGAGFLEVTAGKSISQDVIKTRIVGDASLVNLRTIGYDRWNAIKLVQELDDEGLQLEGIAQTIGSLSAPTKELMRLVNGRLLRHGHHPVLRWMVSNVVPLFDAEENVKPDKKRSKEKIDGVVAACNALKVMSEAQGSGDFAIYMGMGSS